MSARTDTRDFLVIGYGNEMRGDDGVGPRVARAVQQLSLPHVRVIVQHQLTPELSEEISRARAVVFVDAAVENEGCARGEKRPTTVLKVEPCEGSNIMAHASSPETLLSLSRALFGTAPTCWAITIPASQLGFGNELSLATENAAAIAVYEVMKLWMGAVTLGSEKANSRKAATTSP